MLSSGLDLNSAANIGHPERNSRAGGIYEHGKLVLAQIMKHLPLTTSHRFIARYGGKHKVKTFSCLDQYLCMAFAQLTYRESLRDIEACLRAQEGTLYHMGIRSSVPAIPWPMRTRCATGASTPTWPSRSLESPAVCMPRNPLASI